MIFTCANPDCRKTFRRNVARGERAVHCSYACKFTVARKIKPKDLRAIALTGATIQKMADHFGADRNTVRKCLKADGLTALWSKSRYKKCGAVPKTDSRPRWRWDWKCSWWYRSTETTFEVWDPDCVAPITGFRP